MRRRALVLLLLAVAACAAEKDPVARLVSEVEAAAEARDAAEVMEHVSASYPSRAEAENTLRRYFFGYKSFELHVRDLQSTISGSEAFATFSVDMVGVPKELGGMDQFLPRTATYRFELTLVHEGSDWKVSSARWEAVR